MVLHSVRFPDRRVGRFAGRIRFSRQDGPQGGAEGMRGSGRPFRRAILRMQGRQFH